MRSFTRCAIATLVLGMAVHVPPVSAQGVRPLAQQRMRQSGPPSERAQLERRVWAAFYQGVQRELALDSAEVLRVREAIERFREPRQTLLREERELRMRTRRFLEGGSTDANEARALLDGMTRIKEREVALFREEQSALLRLLPPEKVVRLYQRRDQLMQGIQRAGPRRGPPGGPGGGGPGGDGPGGFGPRPEGLVPGGPGPEGGGSGGDEPWEERSSET